MSIGDIVRTMARVVGADIRIACDGVTDEYIEFRSADGTMADRFGVVPRIPFEQGFDSLRRFVADHEGAAVRG